jgi:hypothetical protein
MFRIAAAAAGLVLAGLTTADQGTAPAADPQVAEAKGLVKEFATTLQGDLQASMQAGGPTKAISVCQDRAPAIAADLSSRSGWDVGRTSLKTRNVADNAPDTWETRVLETFEARKAAGEPVGELAFAETVETEAGKQFRFMKAIPTGKVCLACHGSALTEEVAAAIDAAYPQDQARGFSEGDIRGAFTLSKPL